MHPSPELSLEELALFNELFAQRFGLHFPEHKLEILESRLMPRLRANHLQRFVDYYLHLQYDFEREQDELTQAITNNESYFFREISQMKALDGEVISGLRAGGEIGWLRCLSAGCSSGEEPYTLNIFLRHILNEGSLCSIDAIDLDSERLSQAKAGVYRPSSLRALAPEQIATYFIQHSLDAFELKRHVRKGVNFRRGNILHLDAGPDGAKSWSAKNGGAKNGGAQNGGARNNAYDAVFCRNVLIYFAEPALKAAIDEFARVLRPGGLLFLGHSESIIGLTSSFQAERLGSCIAYRRTDA